MTWDQLDGLALYRYRIDLSLERDLAIASQQRAAIWRGAFGASLRSLVCHDRNLECDGCPLAEPCPYVRVFAPRIPDGRPVIARLHDPPRPFVLTDPRPDADSLPRTTSLALGMVVAGTAIEQLLYLLVTIRKQGELGLGRHRVKFAVEQVRSLDADGLAVHEVWRQGSDLVRAHRTPLRARDLMRPGDDRARRVRVRFITPTDVRSHASAAASGPSAPSFGALLRRARDRVGALATFFGDGALDFDPRQMATLADEVTTLSSDVTAERVQRRSARTGQRHPIGGVVGSAVYEGDAIARLMPWLRVVELVGVGKHATFGNGRVAVELLA